MYIDQDLKDLFTVTAIIMTVAISGTYTYKAWSQPSKVPHVVAWGCMTVLAAFSAGVQVAAGAGFAASILMLTTGFNATNFLIGWKKRGSSDFNRYTSACAGLAVAAAILWLLTDNPTLAAMLLACAGVAAFLPIVLRTWDDPLSEVQGTYWANTVRYAVATLAVSDYSWATMLIPGTWTLINGGFSVYHAICLKRATGHSSAARSIVAVPVKA